MDRVQFRMEYEIVVVVVINAAVGCMAVFNDERVGVVMLTSAIEAMHM